MPNYVTSGSLAPSRLKRKSRTGKPLQNGTQHLKRAACSNGRVMMVANYTVDFMPSRPCIGLVLAYDLES